MKKKIALLLTLQLINCALSAPAEPALKTHSLVFTETPTNLVDLQRGTNGSLAVLYYSRDENHLNYCLDFFSEIGEPIYFKRFCSREEEPDFYPLAQVIMLNDHVRCEYYPDIETMDVCYITEFLYDGTETVTDHKQTFAIGDASYASHFGNFILQMQAHSYDDERESVWRKYEVIHAPSGVSKTFIEDSYDTYAFAIDDNFFFLAYESESNRIRVQRYSNSATLEEQIFFIHLENSTTDWNLVSATYVGEQLLIQLSSVLGDETGTVIACEPATGITKTIGTLPTNEELQNIGHFLLVSESTWDESLQTSAYQFQLPESNKVQTSLRLTHDRCYAFWTEGDTLYTFEYDIQKKTFFLCQYQFTAT